MKKIYCDICDKKIKDDVTGIVMITQKLPANNGKTYCIELHCFEVGTPVSTTHVELCTDDIASILINGNYQELSNSLKDLTKK